MRAGADRVLSPYQIGGLQLAQTALRPAVVDFVQLATSSDNLELNMEQVRIGEGASLAGRTIVEANLRQRFGVVVVGIQRAGGRDGVQSAARERDAAWAIISSCSAGRAPARARGRGRRRLRPSVCPEHDERPTTRRPCGGGGDSRVGAAGRARVHGARGPAARARHRARRRGSGVGDLRPQQGPGGHASPGCGSICSGCRRPRRSTSCSALVRRLNASDEPRRHPGAVAAAGGDGPRRRAAGVRRDRSRQGRRRLHTRQRRPAGPGPCAS